MSPKAYLKRCSDRGRGVWCSSWDDFLFFDLHIQQHDQANCSLLNMKPGGEGWGVLSTATSRSYIVNRVVVVLITSYLASYMISVVSANQPVTTFEQRVCKDLEYE